MSCFFNKVLLWISFNRGVTSVIIIMKRKGEIENLNLHHWQALVNVGADLSRQVPGRVSTEIDARLAYDTQGIVRKVFSITLRIVYNTFFFPMLV